jgi:hypothetical protein
MGWIKWSKETIDKQQGQIKGVGMPRGPRPDAPGTLDHMIVRGIERRKIVDNDKDREDFVTRLGAIALDTGISIYAWALRPIMLTFYFAAAPPACRHSCAGFFQVMPYGITENTGAMGTYFKVKMKRSRWPCFNPAVAAPLYRS